MNPRRDGRQQPTPRYALESRRVWLLATGLCLALAGVGAAIGVIIWPSSDAAPAPLRAAIVDQLAATDPNPDFIQAATQQLQGAGYVVDYYQPNKVTVNLYRELPKRGYAFILVRSHASESINKIDPKTGKFTGEFTESSGLFTNEIYHNTAYLEDQRAARLMVDSYADRPIKEKFFGITAEFISSAVRGDFHGATVVVLGCSGLKTDDLAKAFVARGASDFVSWDGSVTAQHTDAAGDALLKNLFTARLEVREAVARTMQQVGADPAFGSHLVAYP